MTDIALPPDLLHLCNDCETICRRECCGLNAFNVSPVGVIHHPTRYDAGIRKEDVARLRSAPAQLSAQIRERGDPSAQVCLEELNAPLPAADGLLLVEEVDAALTEACAIHAALKDRLDARYAAGLRIAAAAR